MGRILSRQENIVPPGDAGELAELSVMPGDAGDLAELPTPPLLSRFVAPWDTSGWYYPAENFGAGSRLYSNSDLYALTVPDELRGGEYVVAYDSYTDGFDDKQGATFHVECPARIYIAPDSRADTDFLTTAGFVATSLTLTISNGDRRPIFSRDYAAGSVVRLPDCRGNWHHYCAVIRAAEMPSTAAKSQEMRAPGAPAAEMPSAAANSQFVSVAGSAESSRPAPEAVYSVFEPQRHRSLPPRWYLNENFRTIPIGMRPPDFHTTGMVRKIAPDCPGLVISPSSSLSRELVSSGCDQLELDIAVAGGDVCVEWGGLGLSLSPGRAILDGRSVGNELGSDFRLRFLRCRGEGEIWVNSRRVETLTLPIEDCRSDENGTGEQTTLFKITTDANASARLTYMSLRDRTDVPVMEIIGNDTNEKDICADWQVGDGTEVQCCAYPFSDSRTLGLRRVAPETASDVTPIAPGLAALTAARRFPALYGEARAELIVRPSGAGFNLLCDLRDSAGRPAMRAALYRHNLYVSRGERWQRVHTGHIAGFYTPSDNWYHLRVELDLRRGVYSLRVDGATRAEDFPLISSVDHVAQVGFVTEGESFYLMKLAVFDSLSSTDRLLPPGAVHDVRALPYGAAGDGETLDTVAIQNAINDAAVSGGTVLLSGGIFLSGGLFLRSDVTLWITRDATLLSAQDHGHFPLVGPTDSLCAQRQLGRGLIYGENLRNVRLGGGGAVDGNGRYRFKMNDPVGNREADARPSQVYITDSEGIVIEDLRFVNAAFWSVVPLSCRNLLIEDLAVDCMNTPNRDGIDPVDCVDATIRRCDIVAGDDGLCFKSSADFGCRNIDVSELVIQSLASGIKFGTDSYHSFVNINIDNCILKNINRCGVSVESVDGAEIAGLRLAHLDISETGAPVYMVIGTRGRLAHAEAPRRESSIEGVRFHRLRYGSAYKFSQAPGLHQIMIVGADGERPIRGVRFSDCVLELPGGGTEPHPAPEPLGKKYPEYDQHGASAGSVFTIRYAEDITVRNCKVILRRADVRSAIAVFDSLNIEF